MTVKQLLLLKNSFGLGKAAHKFSLEYHLATRSEDVRTGKEELLTKKTTDVKKKEPCGFLMSICLLSKTVILKIDCTHLRYLYYIYLHFAGKRGVIHLPIVSNINLIHPRYFQWHELSQPLIILWQQVSRSSRFPCPKWRPLMTCKTRGSMASFTESKKTPMILWISVYNRELWWDILWRGMIQKYKPIGYQWQSFIWRGRWSDGTFKHLDKILLVENIYSYWCNMRAHCYSESKMGHRNNAH